MHMKAKGRWACDIAYIYSRFCPGNMERECVRAIGRTDATPFMEPADAHWASVANWTEDSIVWATMKSSMTAMGRYRTMTQTAIANSAAEVGFEVRYFLRLRLRHGVAFSDGATRRRVQRNRPRPRSTLTNSAVVLYFGIFESREGPRQRGVVPWE